MMKAFSFFALMFAGTSLLVSTMSGGGGLHSTQLNGAITEGDMALVVLDNSGFNAAGVLWIDYEKVSYNAMPNGTDITLSARGYDGTTATSHANGAYVRSEDNDTLNSVFGFNVGQVVDNWGLFAFPIVLVKFFSTTVPYLLQGNMGSLFQGNGLAIVVDLWLVFGAGFIFMLVMALINARRV
jgi:hypothetical protein